MSTLPQRLENRCLNCNALTHGRYCQVCGQENVEHKLGFFGLIKHFVFDLLHFDGKFFTTLKMLFTKPGQVPLEYVSGKRIKHLEPFKMFIFTTTIFFILTTIIPSKAFEGGKKLITINDGKDSNTDTVRFSKFTFGDKVIDFAKYNSFNEIMQDYNKTNEIGFFQKAVIKKNYDYYKKNYSFSEIVNALKTDFLKALPKMIFCMLPFFIGFLQLLHIRHKKWHYNEHGIFSLYLFSFVYIQILIIQILYSVFSFLAITTQAADLGLNILTFLLLISLAFYTIFSLKHFYKQSFGKSLFKFIVLFFGSVIIITIFLFIYLIVYLVFL